MSHDAGILTCIPVPNLKMQFGQNYLLFTLFIPEMCVVSVGHFIFGVKETFNT